MATTIIYEWSNNKVTLEVDGVPVVIKGRLRSIEIDGEKFNKKIFLDEEYDIWKEAQK